MEQELFMIIASVALISFNDNTEKLLLIKIFADSAANSSMYCKKK